MLKTLTLTVWASPSKDPSEGGAAFSGSPKILCGLAWGTSIVGMSLLLVSGESVLKIDCQNGLEAIHGMVEIIVPPGKLR